SWFGWGNDSFAGVAGSAFSAALADVARIGIYITYQPNLAGQVYGIDNFGLTVPEPETYMILGMALLSVAVVFRRRITESLAEARAVLQA
ncbi:MAG: PEP-CTERM sorting domain-containing protein, partial [Kiritimatiellia bacterium]